MPSFQPATRQNYENLQNLLNGASAYGDWWPWSDNSKDLGGFYVLPNGELYAFNTVKKEALLLVQGGKPTKQSFSGTAYDSLYTTAKRSGRKIEAEEAKRIQEDAGRKYKTAATRLEDKLLYKTWKHRNGAYVVEATPSFIKIKFEKNSAVGGKNFGAGKDVVVKNDDPAYKSLATAVNNDYKAGKLSVSKSETSADTSLRRQTAKAKLDPRLLGKTWNDGTYTYKVGDDRTVKVKDKTWTPGKGTYDTVAKQLNVMYMEKKLKEGALEDSAALDEAGLKEMKADLQMSETGEKGTGEEEGAVAASSSASSSASAEPKAEIREGKGKDGGLTDSKYFWPAVGVGGLALAGGVYFFFFRKK